MEDGVVLGTTPGYVSNESPALKETERGRQLRIKKEGVPTGCRGVGALMFRERAAYTEGQEGFLT